jgi:hypothetical protein
MPRSTAPKETSPSPQQVDPTCLIGKPADVPQPVSEEIVIGKVDPKPQPAAAPTPVVTTDSDGNIVIK